ncbi:Cu(I)-responsive transcriptional regulator [Terasakiella sp. A23]|uniref:Cu(I)-responsive transcriptional regulator n=1 Tax=Terasakiella sp. FCG-A23 TaxID=3080561 RepID=UPI0029531584|nr:Cu(I)-responsive transcriptional regulator [Terasakiella sp. A23]MDV7338890.1 Cu(I)-responsive transcriptional regulator [Terasakiella sp. A23]
MNISAVSKLTGVTAKTIRYYESIDLMPEPRRAENGYRDYSDKDVEILKFIQSARKMGFPLKDVANLLELWQDRNRASRDVRELAESHIQEVENRIAELQNIRDTLKNLVDCCHGDDRPDCPILNSFVKKEEDCGCD